MTLFLLRDIKEDILKILVSNSDAASEGKKKTKSLCNKFYVD